MKRRTDPLSRALKERDEALRERDEARAFQAATDEILTAVGRSTSDAKPVFDAIVQNVPRLFQTRYVSVFLVKGDELHLAAAKADSRFEKQHAAAFRKFRESFPQPIDWRGFTGKALRSGKVSQMAPIIGNPRATPQAVKLARQFGYNTMLVAPLVRDGKTIGAIGTTRPEVKPFNARELALFKAFAAQAVIAIENARLFNETKEALEQQTATAEVLQVISGSVADAKPVFTKILQSCKSLFAGGSVGLALLGEDDMMHLHLIPEDPERPVEDRRRWFIRVVEAAHPRPARDSIFGYAMQKGQVLYYPDVANGADVPEGLRESVELVGTNYSTVIAPLLWAGRGVGALNVVRVPPAPFSDKEIRLLKTFADQAVIAIQNARLFNETKEALEQQTATAEILKVIAGSPSDVQPVFEAILRSATQLCAAERGLVFRVDGGEFQTVAGLGLSEEARAEFFSRRVRPGPQSGLGRVLATRKPVHLADVTDDEAYRRGDPLRMRTANLLGARTAMWLPLLKDDTVIGAFAIYRQEVRPFTEQQIKLVETFAAQAVIAIENARLFNETKEALERQKATSEILGAISSSPTDLQPIFDVILENTLRLCDANLGIVGLCDGNKYQTGAQRGASAEFARYLAERGPLEPPPDTALGRMIAERRPVHVADLKATATYRNGIQTSVMAVDVGGIRTFLGVPMLREGRVVGGISIYRREVRPFTQKQIDLVSTFADQAVIAIENVRLFNETKEALERQTATSEVLRVISGTPADPQPVFEAIAQSAVRVFNAPHAGVALIDGDLLRQKATAGRVDPRGLPLVPFDRTSMSGSALLEKTTVDVPDTEVPGAPAFARDSGRLVGFRAIGSAPMLREGKGIGAITVMRAQPGALTDKQRELLQTFADQAVIAIENARLFNETKEALEQQTATADILKVIASSPTDVQPVFDVIVERAVRLCGARFGRVYRYDGATIHLVASSGLSLSGLAQAQRVFPRPLGDDSIVGQTILARAPRFVADVERDRTVPEMSRQLIKALNTRSQVTMPMLRAGQPIGAITVGWDEPEAYDERKVALLRTFADQAVIAIENVRLFNETKEALEQQTASADVLRVIGSSPSDLQPVFDAILESAMRLCEASLATVGLYDGKHYRHVAQRGGSPEYAKFLFAEPFEPNPQYTLGRVIAERQPFHIADYRELPAYKEGNPRAVATVELGGARTFLAVPMLKEGQAIGGITIRRTEVRPFTQKQIDLVKTFADQAVIAIENARLFNETREALERQTATAEILKVISASPTSTQPVFESIVKNCGTLYKDSRVALWLISDGTVFPRASTGYLSEPIPLERDSGIGACILESRTIHLPDLRTGAEQYPRIKQLGLKHGYLSGMFAPLLREGRAVGAISVLRRELGAFSEKEVALLTTFADQAVIAIENARLFNETKEALERQTATADVLKVISSSPSDVRPVFRAVAERAAQLCNAMHASVTLADGGVLRVVARVGRDLPYTEVPIRRTLIHGRAFLERRTVQVEDVVPLLDSEYPDARENQRRMGFRTLLAVPMAREGRAIGTIGIWRDEVKPFSRAQIELLETFAAQAVIAIENARLFNETKEALEQQTAISEVLRVISDSPTDVKPVLDAVALRAAKICEASDARIWLTEPGAIRHVAGFGDVPMPVEQGGTIPLSRGTVSGRAVLDCAPVHIEDASRVAAEDYPVTRELQARSGFRTILAVPLMRESRALGAIMLRRLEVRRFSDKQIALLRTFADQAAIAIENVRLFNETREALERQTAMAEVLQVISASMADTAPVFDKILQSCKKLFSSAEHGILLVAEDGRVRIAAHHGSAGGRVTELVAAGLADGQVQVEAIRRRKALHFVDALADEARGPVQRVAQQLGIGSYSQVVAPMLWEDQPVGWLYAIRQPATGFKEAEITLLKTFADQAVIAIQNARLFNETKEALERQTATADILRVISSSPTDTRPVFDVIAKSGLRLFGGLNVAILLRREKDFVLAGYSGPGMEDLPEQIRAAPLDPEKNFPSRAILEGKVLSITDWESADVPEHEKVVAKSFGIKSGLMVPLLRQGEGIGAIAVMRATEGPFTDKDIALLRSFADQAVIAIENVRLFKELQERTEALTKSVGQLTALGEVGQAISSSLELETVLKTIVQRAVQLAGLDSGSIYEFEARDERFHLRAAENIAKEILDVSRTSRIRLGEGVVGRAGATREPVVVEDVLDESYQSRVRKLLIKSGARALLAVPLLREDLLLGALVVSRKSPGPFAPEAVELLKTFATQSAVAIQNARLFREIAEKSKQLEEASRHKSQFLASMSHELRTPLNAILGFNEMILGQVYGEVPSDMKEPLEDIQKSGKHLLRLINNVLDLAKIEAGRMELALADYSVQDTVESVRSTLRPLAEAKGLELVASVQQDIPLAYGDGGRLTQCLMNLAGNSLKFTKEGRVEIAVEAQNGLLKWRVSDTGIGIPPDKIPTLFSEFKQTDATIASEYGGTGLGLSITKKFVEMHGGRIWVESEPGKGSTFTLEIPLRVKAPA